MDANDELREQLKTFHTDLTELYRRHQQTIALRYLSSLQPKPNRMQKATKRMRPLLVRSRRFLSHQLHALAQLVDPDPINSPAWVDAACTDHGVDSRNKPSEEEQDGKERGTDT